MEYQIVNLVVSMYQGSLVLWLQLLVLEESHRLLKVRQLSHRLLGLNVYRLGLIGTNRDPSLDLTVVKPVRFPKLFQTNLLVVHSVESRQCLDRFAPQRRALLGTYAGHGEILKDASVKELHDVKGRADDRLVFTEAIGLGYGDIGVLEGVEDAVLALDFMGSLGDELARRLLAHNELLFVGGDDLVGRVGLTEAELGRRSVKTLSSGKGVN